MSEKLLIIRLARICIYIFIYYSWNGGRAEAVCAGGTPSGITGCQVTSLAGRNVGIGKGLPLKRGG